MIIHIYSIAATFPPGQLPVQLPDPLEESSLLEPSIGEVEVGQPTVTYQIVEEGTKRRKQKLIDSLGYTYNIKERGKASTYWQCTVRPKGNYCKATIRETGGQFVGGTHSHNHPVDIGAAMAAKITSSVKRKALDDIFKPASAIVEEVIVNEFLSYV